MTSDKNSRVISDLGPFSLVPRWVLDADVSDGAVRLYALLGDYADRHGECWPGRATLAERLRTSRATVDRRVTELEEAGALQVRRRGGKPGEAWSSNLYLLRRLPPSSTDEATPSSTGGPSPSSTGGASLGPPVLTEPDPVNQTHLNQSLVPVGTDPQLPDSLRSSPLLADAQRLAELLADLIADNGSRRPNVTGAWVRDLERLMRIDERTPQQVEAAIRWCQQHEFWRANILSPAKLRKQYDRLRLQAKAEQRDEGGKPGSAASMMRVLQDLDDQYEEPPTAIGSGR